MFKILLNPVFSIATGELLSHDGESFVEDFPIKLDREIQGTAKKNAKTASDVATGFGSTAAGIGSSLIPGLERDANNPTGYDPITKNRMLVSNQEAAGGVGAGIAGDANLMAARTRNAGGFARALDESARAKGRLLTSGARDVENESARLAALKQQQARGQLAGLYNTDVSGQLRAMGLSDEDLRTALEAGKSGWQQNAMGWIDTLGGAAGKYKPKGWA